ncbi:MAG: Uncharacterized protein Greene041662_276, partial [Candidatus Peregrinibacteria bacterium Greene0416_62]
MRIFPRSLHGFLKEARLCFEKPPSNEPEQKPDFKEVGKKQTEVVPPINADDAESVGKIHTEAATARYVAFQKHSVAVAETLKKLGVTPKEITGSLDGGNIDITIDLQTGRLKSAKKGDKVDGKEQPKKTAGDLTESTSEKDAKSKEDKKEGEKKPLSAAPDPKSASAPKVESKGAKPAEPKLEAPKVDEKKKAAVPEATTTTPKAGGTPKGGATQPNGVPDGKGSAKPTNATPDRKAPDAPAGKPDAKAKEGAGAKPEGDPKAAKEATDKANAAAKEVGGEKVTKLTDAFAKIKETANQKPANWDAFFAAIKDVLAAIKDIKDDITKIFHPESEKPKGQPTGAPNTPGNAPGAAPSATPSDGSNKQQEGGEKPNDRETRLRTELKDSPKLNSAEDLIKAKEAKRDQERGKFDADIQKINGEIPGLQTTSDTLNKTIQELGTGKDRDVVRKIEDLQDDLKANNNKITRRKQEVSDLQKQQKGITDKAQGDIDALKAMRAEVGAQKQLVDSIASSIKDNPDLAKASPERAKILGGLRAEINEKSISLKVSLTPEAKAVLEAAAARTKVDISGLIDKDGVVNGGVEKLMAAMQKIEPTNNTPNTTNIGTEPASSAATVEFKGTPLDVFKGTRADTITVLKGRIERAQAALKDAKADLGKKDGSSNLQMLASLIAGPLANLVTDRISTKGVTKNEITATENVIKALQAKLSEVEAMPEQDVKKMDTLVKIRVEGLRLPAIPGEFAKDYDSFQKMASEAAGQKKGDMEVDYAALNKELQDIDATLANVEMGVKVLDTGMTIAAGTVPGGSLVYQLARNGTAVFTGEMSPTEAATNIVMSQVLGKGGKVLMATKAGKAVVDKYVQKIAKELADPAKLKNILHAVEELGAEAIAVTTEKVSHVNKYVAKGIEGGQKWLGENGYAFYEKSIAPTLQNLSEEGQKQFAQGMKAFQEIKTGIMTSTATDFAQGYKGKFKEMYGGAIQSATDQIKKIPKINPAEVDKLVALVTTTLEQKFDAAAKTVQDIN